jgi:hypothetical protein
VYSTFYNDNTVKWHDWFKVANSMPSKASSGSSVTAISRYPGGTAIDLFVNGNDGSVYSTFYNDNTAKWHDWFKVANSMPSKASSGSSVAAISRYPGGTAIDLFVNGNDGSVYSTFYNDNTVKWHDWFKVTNSMPSSVSSGSSVTAISRYPCGGTIDLFVNGKDGDVYSTFFNDKRSEWHVWFKVANSLPSSVSSGSSVTAISRYPGGAAIDLFVNGKDGNVYSTFFNDKGGIWHDWFKVANPLPSSVSSGSSVTAISRYSGGAAIDLFVNGKDGNVYSTFFNDMSGIWHDWFKVANSLPSSVSSGSSVTAISRYPDGTAIDLFVNGKDGNVYSTFFNDKSGKWYDWFKVASAHEVHGTSSNNYQVKVVNVGDGSEKYNRYVRFCSIQRLKRKCVDEVNWGPSLGPYLKPTQGGCLEWDTITVKEEYNPVLFMSQADLNNNKCVNPYIATGTECEYQDKSHLGPTTKPSKIDNEKPVCYPASDKYYFGCGINAAQSALAYFGIYKIQGELKAFINTISFPTTSNIAVYPDDLKNGLQKLLIIAGLNNIRVCRRSDITKDEKVQSINQSLLAGFPVIALVDGGSHWIVIVGEENGNYLVHSNFNLTNRTADQIDIDFGNLEGFLASIDGTSYNSGTMIFFEKH